MPPARKKKPKVRRPLCGRAMEVYKPMIKHHNLRLLKSFTGCGNRISSLQKDVLAKAANRRLMLISLILSSVQLYR